LKIKIESGSCSFIDFLLDYVWQMLLVPVWQRRQLAHWESILGDYDILAEAFD
jgi:hypothetical protein